MIIEKLIDNLNHDKKEVRLDSLKELMNKINEVKLERPTPGSNVNNHIHTAWSFSPYSPTKAVWMAYKAGLSTAGIMDHDAILGAPEFIEAGKIVNLATTIGVECRADFSTTALNGRRINNPDQRSIAYVAIHGIPHTQIDKVEAFFKPYREKRNNRNRKMIEKLNELLSPFSIELDFDSDVIPISKYNEGGSITERHILYALSLKLILTFGKGQPLISFLRNDMKLNLSNKAENYLLDPSNPHYVYDLLGILKSDLVGSFYINASDECPDIKDVAKLSNEISAILAYAYLGDVGESVTGDKKAQKFEDDYLELLFETLDSLGFDAVTYMPSRNTPEQLDRVRALCDRYSLFQISGEDINSSRQSFICKALEDEKFSNLIDSTWALIGHERAATNNLSEGMFTKETKIKLPDLNNRIQAYKKLGEKKD